VSQRDKLISAIAEQQYGVFTHEQAKRAGFSPAAIQRRVQGGLWRRVGSGVYAIAGLPFTFECLLLTRILEVGGAMASHRTAGHLHRLDGFSRKAPVRIELMVLDRRGIAAKHLTVHRPRLWLPADKVMVAGIPTTSVARTLFDIAAVCRQRTVQIAFDDALRKETVTVEEMARRLDEVRRPGVRGLKKIAAIIADRAANELEDSELETMFRKLITSAGLPPPVAQYTIWRDDGYCVAEVDFAYPDIRLAIELDSWTYHGGRKPFEDDRVKQYELFDLGWHCLRFTKSDLRLRGDRVTSVVSRRLRDFGPTQSRIAT
jgi:hypothetical protein